MKTKTELQSLIQQIVDPKSPVGMDAAYVHALILDKLQDLDRRLAALEDRVGRDEEEED